VTALLGGIQVLDMGRLVAPGYASARLADLGAAVTKVELTPDGDYLRKVPPLFDNVSVLHWELNRGKRSLALNWRKPEASDVLRRLVARSDVFIESTLAGGAARMGLDWDSLKQVNPRLVHCSITSFGDDRPYTRLRAHGLNIDAAAGVAPVSTNADGDPEIGRLTHWVASQAAGLNAAMAIIAALFARERSGAGRHLHVSCWDAAVSFNYQSMITYANLGTDFPYPSPRDGFGPRYNSYRAADGRFVLLAAAERKFWERFCVAAGHPELIGESEMFSYEADPASAEAEQRVIAKVMAERPAAEWIQLAAEHELPITPIHTAPELLELPQTEVSGMLAHRTGLAAGHSFRHVSSPVQVQDAPFSVGAPAPAFGADSVAVLGDAAFTRDEVDRLVAGGVVIDCSSRAEGGSPMS